MAQSTNLGEAVDAPYLVWTTGGHTNWLYQTSVTFDGVDAAQSGFIKTNQETWIETVINGPGTLSFWWKVKTGPTDGLQFYINGQLQAQIFGDIGWQYRVFSLPEGPNTNRWRYFRPNHPGGYDPDAAYLDQVIFTTAEPLPLAKALDTCGAVWSTGGNSNPTYWTGQTNVTRDGVDAAQSGAITDSQESWLACSVSGVTNVSFWWKVSSETNADLLEFWVDSTRLTNISGEVNWVSNRFVITPAPHTLKWRFFNDDGVTAGQNRGWVDQIVFRPPLTNAPLPFSLSPPVLLTNRAVRFSVLMPDEDCSCRVLYSTNLSSTNWLVLTNFSADAIKTVVDPSATNQAQRFYRAVSP